MRVNRWNWLARMGVFGSGVNKRAILAHGAGAQAFAEPQLKRCTAEVRFHCVAKCEKIVTNQTNLKVRHA